MSKLTNLDNPLNANERMLYGINKRLEILIEQFSSFLEVYANQQELAVTENTTEEVNTEVDYNSFTMEKLKLELDLLGIEYKSNMRKAELVRLLEEDLKR